VDAILQTASGMTLKLRLTPKSSRDEIVGIEDFGGKAEGARGTGFHRAVNAVHNPHSRFQLD
jgi:hypothetical protein